MFKRKAKPQSKPEFTYTLKDLLLDEKKLKDLTPKELVALTNGTSIHSAVYDTVVEEIIHRLTLGRPKGVGR